ncbi:MAG: ABC transporter permease [Saprospiraceae bacterium]|nr:ABC transporter permease [Saprospiraceae bacterium]
MESRSEWAKTWSRFRQNRPAYAGLWFICMAILIAFTGYWIAPDHSPNANAQIPETALSAPGFRMYFLKQKLDKTQEDISFADFLINGKPLTYKHIALHQPETRLKGDSLLFQSYGSAEAWKTIALTQLESGTPTYQIRWLGTDKYGRCMLSRLILGFRVSLTVGFIAVVISLTLGVILGALGGYLGGKTDDLVMLVINTVWSIPTLLLVFAVVLALGRGIGIIFLAVGLTMWVDVARVVRGQVLVLKQLAFVEAAKSMGIGHKSILFKHILPNLMGPLMVLTAGNFATAILLESGLSYLGFGVQPPAPSWGNLLNENYGYALSGKPFLALAPALTIAFTVLAFNLIGNGLRDALDVKK